jgi:LPS-assembly lipoprotein
MSWSDRRRALGALAAAALAAGCGFRPVYGDFGGGDAAAEVVDRRIRVESPPGRTGYFYARALRRKLGQGGAEAPFVLESTLSFGERETAITVEDDVTRFDVIGAATWRLSRVAGAEPVAEGSVRAVSAYNTLALPYATRTAAEDATRRVSEELAARVFIDLAAALSRIGPA